MRHTKEFLLLPQSSLAFLTCLEFPIASFTSRKSASGPNSTARMASRHLPSSLSWPINNRLFRTTQQAHRTRLGRTPVDYSISRLQQCSGGRPQKSPLRGLSKVALTFTRHTIHGPSPCEQREPIREHIAQRQHFEFSDMTFGWRARL